MNVFEGRAGLTIEARRTIVHIGAGFLAVVAAHAQTLVDQQHIGAFAEPLTDQKADEISRIGFALALHVLCQTLEYTSLDTTAQCGVAVEHVVKAGGRQQDGFAINRGPHRRRALRLGRQQRHLANIVARGDIRQHHLLATDHA